MRLLATLLLLAFLTPFTSVASAQTVETNTVGELEVVKPNIRIQIPGLDEKELDTKGIVKGTGTGENGNGCEEGELCVQSIEIYLNAVYRFALSAGVIIAIVLVMIGGIQWMVGSTVGSNEKARERIEHAIIGLLLLFGTYAILAFINPNITSLQPLQLKVIPAPKETAEATEMNTRVSFDGTSLMFWDDILRENDLETFEFEGAGSGDIVDGLGGSQRVVGSTVKASDVITVQPEAYLKEDLAEPLLKAAATLKALTGEKLRVESAGRSMRKQVSELYNNCFGHACIKDVCNPFKGLSTSPIEGSSSKGFALKAAYKEDHGGSSDDIINFLTEQGEQLTTMNCPHVVGVAVDVWCDSESSGHVDPVCHLALENAMRANGFSRIYTEGWHFEYGGSSAPSTAAQAGDWTPGKVTSSTSSKCSGTTQKPGHAIEMQGGKSRCLFDYTTCTGETPFANINASSTQCVK